MEWVLIIALGVWVLIQSRRIDALTQRVQLLEAYADEGFVAPAPSAAPQPAAPAPKPAEDLEPLLLDTPLPEPSNDRDEIEEGDEPPEEATKPAMPARPPVHEPALTLVDRADPQPIPAQATASRRGFDQWLAENGLAWIGGGLLALGAVFLVGFVAQSPLFTPLVRVWTAAVLGAAFIGGGEWVRRLARRGGGHPLVAALLAGAGATTIYLSVWAAHALYGLITWPTAVSLFALCAILLVFLSRAHGQPLGVLAIVALLIAPAITGTRLWPHEALTVYLCAAGGAGVALAILRRWIWTAAIALLGLYVWFADAISIDDLSRALALVAVASLAAAAIAFRHPAPEEEPSTFSWSSAQSVLPTSVICISSVFLIWTWLSVAPVVQSTPLGPALVGMFHVALAALAVRMRGALPAAFAVAAGALAVGVLLYIRARAYYAPSGPELYIWPLICAAIVGLSALAARPARSGRLLVAGAGAISSALLIILAAFSRSEWSSPPVWAALFVGAALLIAAAHVVARETGRSHADWPTDLWVGAGAVLTLIGMESLAPAIARPAAQAAVALLFTLLYVARAWRGASWAALAAAALALTHAIAPDFTGAVLDGRLQIARALLFLAAAAAFLFGAGAIATRRGGRTSALSDALSSAAILTILLGAFLGLRWLASGGAGASLDTFTENALRALMLIAAGYIVTPRSDAPIGRIAAARGHVLMGAGLIMAVLTAGLTLNPWWGVEAARIIGPPIFNAQALAFAAPGALASIAAARLYSRNAVGARIYAATGGFLGALWIIMETRRAFHGGDMAPAEIGLLEGSVYGLEALIASLVIVIGARIRLARKPERPFTLDLARAMRTIGVAGALMSLFFLLGFRHPWWGAQDPALTNALETGLAVFAQGVAAGLSLILGRALSRAPGVDGARFIAAATAALFGLSFGLSLIRWSIQFGDMDNYMPLYGLEGIALALWPLVYVLGASAITASAPGRDTVRAYLYDLQAIWASAIWPAMAFTALGLWLFYNPWWGLLPARAETLLHALTVIGASASAAWLTVNGAHVPHLRAKPIYVRVATVVSAGHLFVALSLAIRRAFHGADMTAGLSGSSAETWAYSVTWALFGGALVALGSKRRDATLRWTGLALLLFVIGKVLVFDTATLSGVVRAASVMGVALILIVVTLAVRRANAQGSRR